MNKNTFLTPLVVGGGFLFLCAAPRLGFGQSRTPGAAPPRMESASAQPGNHASPPDLLAGLTLTDDQKARINQIREDTKLHIAAVAADKKLGPEVTNAMFQGYQRIEKGEILAVLTPEQQREVRSRVSAWRATERQRQQQLQQPSGPVGTPEAK